MNTLVRTAAEEEARCKAEMAAAMAAVVEQRKAARIKRTVIHRRPERRLPTMRVHAGVNLGRLLDAEGVR